jgi:hypothetical protein
MRLRREGSMFFFEKKNRKTLANSGRALPERPQPRLTKVCFFFSKKQGF